MGPQKVVNSSKSTLRKFVPKSTLPLLIGKREEKYTAESLDILAVLHSELVLIFLLYLKVIHT